MSENIIQELHDEMEAEYKIIQSSKKKADDPACWKPVEYKTFMPQTGVKLMGGIFQKMFFQNKAYIKESYRYKDYCKDKTWIEALADLEGNGWYPWLTAECSAVQQIYCVGKMILNLKKLSRTFYPVLKVKCAKTVIIIIIRRMIRMIAEIYRMIPKRKSCSAKERITIVCFGLGE